MRAELILICLAVLAFASPSTAQQAPIEDRPDSRIALVIHGGAGTILKENLTEETEAAYREALETALLTGYPLLATGGSSLDAVEATVRVMEDSPLFNAGKGAVFDATGRNRMDASIMDGARLRAGAVAAVESIKNPIRAARAVMELTSHVMLAGADAVAFARSVGLELAPPHYFFTERRWDQFEKKRAAVMNQQASAGGSFGTVGALALDAQGRLAAATSTGGLTFKLAGRVGDTPVIGAGNYADSECAISGTGQGEFFMRHLVAYNICARKRLQRISLTAAARAVVHEELLNAGGDGGVIGLDSDGNVVMEFNTAGMYRGFIREDGKTRVEIYE